MLLADLAVLGSTWLFSPASGRSLQGLAWLVAQHPSCIGESLSHSQCVLEWIVHVYSVVTSLALRAPGLRER